jgi:F5/8 type C domain
MKRSLAPVLLYLAITIALTYPILRHIGSVIPHDLGDPVLNTWLLWWSSKRMPMTAAWWNAPMFFPAANVMALSELLIGLLPITFVVQWLTHNPVAAYNVAFVLSFPLCGLAAYGLAWELTQRRDAALLAGLAFAFAPYRMGQMSHLQVLSYYWAPIALVGLHRYLRARDWRWLILFGSAWLMQALTNGYALFHLSVLVGLWIIWFGRPLRTALPIVVAWLIAAIPLIPELLKYREVHSALHLVRDINEIKRLSVGLADLFSPSPELVTWGSRLIVAAPERTIFPGLTIMVVGLIWFATSRTWLSASDEPRTIDEKILIWLSGVAVIAALSTFVVGPWSIGPLKVGDFRKPFSLAVLFRLLAFLRGPWMRRAWRRHSVTVFYLAAMAAMFVFALGPEPRLLGRPILYEPPYAWLMRVPGFDTLRVPARFAMLFVLCQCVLLAFAVARLTSGPFVASGFSRTLRIRPHSIVVGLIGVGILVDGWARVHVEQPPAAGYEWPDTVAAVVEVPMGDQHDFDAIYRSLHHGRPIVNGYSGYFPPFYLPFMWAMNDFQFSALPEISRGQVIGIAVNRQASEAARSEETVSGMAGVSRVAEDERWSTFVIQARGLHDERLGANIPMKSISANRNSEDVRRMTDGRIDTAWSGGLNQIGDEEIRIDLGTEQNIGGIVLSMGAFAFGFPRYLQIAASSDQVEWRPAWTGPPAVNTVHAAVSDPDVVPLTIDVGAIKGRYVRIQQGGSAPGIPWWIAELQVRAPADVTAQR